MRDHESGFGSIRLVGVGRGWVCACAVRLFSTRPQLQWSHDSRLSVAKMDIDPMWKKSLHYSLGRVYLKMFVMHHVKAGFHPCTSFFRDEAFTCSTYRSSETDGSDSNHD